MRKLALLIKRIGIAVLKPLTFLWAKLLRPVAIFFYKPYIVFTERLRRFLHAQHKILAILTHRFAIHVFVTVLTVTIIATNVAQAKSVRSDESIQESLVAQIIRPDQEIVITAGAVTPTQTSYIDNSAVVKVTPSIDGTTVIGSESSAVATTTGGSALIKANILEGGGTTEGRKDIVQYTVREGDTTSSIAQKFGITTKTVLWANNLNDESLIKPGQELYILPESGISYTVAAGDTVESIAKKFNASVDDVMSFNDFVSPNDLVAGVEIVVPGGERPDVPKPQPAQQTQLANVRDVFSGKSTNTVPATAARSGSSAQPSGGKGVWPTSTRRISQYFGFSHTGIDIDGEFGDPIYAAKGGKVIQAGWNGGYGISVLIQNSDGSQNRYGHLQSLNVSAGQSVGSGQFLGEMGSTGRSSGSHLHFECMIGGRFVNPYNCVN